MEKFGIKQLGKLIKKPFRAYYYKYLLYEDALGYFGSVTNIHKLTRISRQCVYKARDRGYFDDYHARRLEYCSKGNLKAVYYDDELEVKKALESKNRSHMAKLQHQLERKRKLMEDPHSWSKLTCQQINEEIRG